MAACAHGPQVRRDGQTPYIAHPVRVTLTLMHVFGCSDENTITAALLHDVIEDTTVDYDDLLAAFGSDVADMVAALSKDKRMIEPKREEAYDAQLARASTGARLIKLADVYDNLCDAETPERLRTYLPKADRALALTSDDPALADVRRIVRDLADRLATTCGVAT